jgi:hypothetical protein
MATETKAIVIPDGTLQEHHHDGESDRNVVSGGSASDATGVPQHDKRQPARGIRSFLWHLVQMVLAMEAGMMIYHLLVATLLAGTGFAALTRENRLFGFWMMVAAMTLGMLILMRYHRSTWRYCLEMTLAMLAPLGVMTVLVFFSLLPVQLLRGLGDPVMILAMAAYMLYRPGEHAHDASEHAAHKHPGLAPAEMAQV